MPAQNRRTRIAAVGLIGLGGWFAMGAGKASAETVDFDSPLYMAEKNLVGVDAWAVSSDPTLQYPDNFKIQAGGQAGQSGKWAHILTTSFTTVVRSFPANAGILDIRWKWRALSDSAHFCFSASNNNLNTRLANRGLACIEPKGELSVQGSGPTPTVSIEAWKPNTWHYMRMVLDAGAGKFAVYISEDSLRGVERLMASATSMGGSGALSRIVLRDENGGGYVDVDDISWETTAIWQAQEAGGPGADADTLWSSAHNWSTGVVPDSATHVTFTAGYPAGCLLDKNAAVKSISVASNYKGVLNLAQQTLSVLGKSDFTGGNYMSVGVGHIRYPSYRGSALLPPEGSKTLPPIRHDGTGPLRVEARPLVVANLTQVQGGFDFNGFDLTVFGDFTIRNGQPGTLRNLEGRAISVGGNARLEGTSKDTLLGLSTAPKGWTLAVASPDTLAARFASLGNARATLAQGFALQSADAGGNLGWVLVNAPAITVQPKDTLVKVGEAAVFKVSASSKLPMTFQWLRNDQIIPGANDSLYAVLVTAKADSGASFSCKVSNSAGNTNTASATLKVTFPPPSASPAAQPILDSLSVRLNPSVPGARTYHSRNGSPFLEFTGPIVLRDSTLLRAFSVFGADTSGLITWNFPRNSLPQVPDPLIDPEDRTFRDTLRVTMTPPLAGAVLYFTLDGKTPDSTKTRYLGSFLIDATTTLSVIAYLPGHRPSMVHTHIYIREDSKTIPPPTALPAGDTFTDSIVVRLFPPAAAPEATVYYMMPGQGPLKYTDSLVLRATTTLKAIAISGSSYSDTAVWEFKRRLEAPVATPRTRTFPDTLRVSVVSRITGALVRYTMDGTDPTAFSPLFPASLLLDSTTTLKAVAFKGADVSGLLSETYTLIPASPTVSHRGGDYSSLVTLSLNAAAPRAAIYYTLDGSTPGPERGLPAYGKPFNLDTSATLKAVAVTGAGAKQQRSGLLIENYTFISPGRRVLGPGQRIELSTNYSLVSTLSGAAPVDVEVIAVDSLKAPKGFRDILFGIRLSVPEGALAFPKVVLNVPAGEPRLLYAIHSAEQARYITGNDTADLPAPGTYFLAVDTLAPVITYSGETFSLEDSTRILVSIKDNIVNLLLDLERSDRPSDGFKGRDINGTPLLSISLQNPKGMLRPLTMRLKVLDRSRATSFPADGSLYSLAQRFTGPVRTPASFRIGSTLEDPWDLISIPLETQPPLTLAQLRKNNAAPSLVAVTLNPKTGQYRYMETGEAMPPGASIWLGAKASIPSLVFPSLQTLNRGGRGGYPLTLRPGWNQVANPSLAALFWPVTREFPDAYASSLLKGLHVYDAVKGAYAHADSLEPWRGYFAWYGGSRDTVIALRYDPVPPPPAPAGPKSAKSGVGLPSGFTFRLHLGNGPSVRLGASAQARIGAGVEDEPQPIGRSDKGPRLYASRAGLRLETDLVPWAPGTVHAWSMVAGLPAGGTRSAQDTSVSGPDRAALVTGLTLPEGFAAWAVSRTRGLRFPLTEGAGIPLSAGYTDSFDVVAGPVALVEARLADIPEAVAAFGARVEAGQGRFDLRLQLPQASRVHLKVWSLSGTRLEAEALDLPGGVYRLARDNGGRGYPNGIYFLSLDWTGGGKSGRLTLKIAIP